MDQYLPHFYAEIFYTRTLTNAASDENFGRSVIAYLVRFRQIFLLDIQPIPYQAYIFGGYPTNSLSGIRQIFLLDIQPIHKPVSGKCIWRISVQFTIRCPTNIFTRYPNNLQSGIRQMYLADIRPIHNPVSGKYICRISD